jgi:transcriptional regulator with PAS, ATPase and Fis domain
VGESPALLNALERLARLAPRELTVLVLGETGTGKELAARLVHRTSPRAAGPFVAVNCAALGESLLLSDLFGHVRGAFTGADKDRAGVFETAQRGTVFLDEIGDLPVVAQGMLLRVLQEREVRRVGESLPRRVDVRVVAATHRDLAAAVAAGTFREDLFYRLKVGSVELPPLRERGDDILLLAEHCLARQRGPGFVPTLSRRARELLLAHPFPGNVRELENVLAVAAALAGGGLIEPEHLGLPEPPESAVSAGEEGSYHRKIEEYRRQLLIEELAACRGNQAEAARRLGLSRQGLSYLARQLRLS